MCLRGEHIWAASGVSGGRSTDHNEQEGGKVTTEGAVEPPEDPP